MEKHLLRKILLNAVLGGALLLPNFLATEAEAATTGNTVSVGQKINFGHYWQTATSTSGNKDAVTWIVLGNNGGKLTLMSEKILYADAFNNVAGSGNQWSASEIKATLNNIYAGGGFAGDAFTAAELSAIVVNETTGSKLYLLDYKDVKDGGTYSTIFNGNGSRIASATAFAQNVDVYGNSGYRANGRWWLRSPYLDTFAYVVDNDGSIQHYGVDFYSVGVRPALDLNLPLIFTTAAENGKATATAGNSIKFPDLGSYTGASDIWLDDTQNTSRATGDVVLGKLSLNDSKIAVDYTEAKAGTGSYVSALFFNESGYAYNGDAGVLSTGTLVGYGKGDAEATSAAGTTEIDLNNLDVGNYKAEFFNENSVMLGKRAEVKGVVGVDASKNLSYTVKGAEKWETITAGANNSVTVANGGVLELTDNGSNVANITFMNGSTLKVDGTKITGTAAITVNNSGVVKNGAKLYVSNAVAGTPYKILAGSGISVAGWQTEAELREFWAAYGLLVDNIINNGNEFTIQFKEDPSITIDIPNILQNISTDSKLQNFVDNISLANPNLSTQATVINTMANMNSLANVQQSTYTVSNMAADSIHRNIDVFQRPILARHKVQGIGHREEGIRNRAEGIGHRAEGIRNREESIREREESIREREEGLRDVSANNKDTAEIKTVEQGESENIMPAKDITEPQTYNKEVWANYIHSKRTIDGMKTGKFLQQDSTSQYNGITTGIDLWSSTRGFGGIALTAVDGKTNAHQTAGSIKNETDYKGISIYNRYDTKNTAILTDFTYTHSDHDIKMSTRGTEDITAKPKADAYSVGVKIEQPIATGKNSEIAPYIGARYTNIHTKNYKTSLDLQYDIDSQNIFNIPIGVAWRNQNQIENGWKIGEVLETGYVWNIGDRDSTQHLSYGGINDNIGFAMAGKGEYFARAALRAIHKDTDFEVGYKYTKGDTAKDSQWNFNVNHSFGNANGMPYKSVLLGKIDLLEAANKDLRTENNGLKTENVGLNNQVKDLQMAVTDLQAENARLKALLASKGI